MSIVITFGNEKGGTGKTTLSTIIAAYNASIGKRVLFVDFAPQGQATLSYGLAKLGGVYDWLVRAVPINNIIKAIDSDRIALPTQPMTGMLYLIPGNGETIGIPNQVASFTLLEAIDEVRDHFDLIIMDIDPATSALSTLVYMASDAIVMPTQVEKLSLDGLISTYKSISSFEKNFGKTVNILGIIPNFFDGRRALHLQNLAHLKKFAAQHNWAVWHPIRNLTAFAEASNKGQMVYNLPRTDPSAVRATEDIEAVIQQFNKATSHYA